MNDSGQDNGTVQLLNSHYYNALTDTKAHDNGTMQGLSDLKVEPHERHDGQENCAVQK